VKGENSIEELEEELKRCEENEEYERAAEIQKRIEQIKVFR
jgi:protein-arginine kinase activator protein McsA